MEEFGESVMGGDQFTRGMWEYFTFKRVEVKRSREDAAREKQQGIQGQWHQQSSSEIMRKGDIAIRDSRWEEFKEECSVKGKSSEWARNNT